MCSCSTKKHMHHFRVADTTEHLNSDSFTTGGLSSRALEHNVSRRETDGIVVTPFLTPPYAESISLEYLKHHAEGHPSLLT